MGNKNHCLSIISSLYTLVKDANDFDFWFYL